MKSFLYVITSILLLSSPYLALAQTLDQPKGNRYFKGQEKAQEPLGENDKFSSFKQQRDFSGNYNFPATLNQVEGLGSISNLFFAPVHPDTVKTIVETPEGPAAIYPEASVGSVLDPTSVIFSESNEQFSAFTRYSVDSINFQYQYIKPIDSISETETVTIEDTTSAFFVNGMAKDSFSFNKDTTWSIDSTGAPVDSTPLPSVEVTFTDLDNPQQIADSQTVWPAYDVVIKSNTIDTIVYQNPDSTIKNDEIVFNRQGTSEVKQEVVDTVIIQLYKGSNPLLYTLESVMLTNGSEVNFASPYYYFEEQGVNDRGYQPDFEVAIPLTDEFITTLDSADFFSRAVSVSNIGPRAWNDDSTSLEGIVASTITFKPGYDVQTPDTFADLTADSPIVRHNMFRVGRLFDQQPYRPTTFNNSFNLSSIQKWYHDREFDPDMPVISQSLYRPTNFSSAGNTHYNIGYRLSTQNLGVEEAASDQPVGIKIYPNPASSGKEVKVELKSETNTDARIRLYNTIGKMVQDFGNRRITKQGNQVLRMSTSGLEPGVYFLNIHTSSGEVTRKISVVR